MRIRKRQVPLPLSSLLPVPLSDLYFNRSPAPLVQSFCGWNDGNRLSVHSQPPDRPGGLIQRNSINGCGFLDHDDDDKDEKALRNKKEENEEEDDQESTDDAVTCSKNVVDMGPEAGNSPSQVEGEDNVVKKEKTLESEDHNKEINAGSATLKIKRRKKAGGGGALVEGSRCSRVNGRGWRCWQKTLVGYSLCEHHLGKGRLRSMSTSTNVKHGHRNNNHKDKRNHYYSSSSLCLEEENEGGKKRVKLGMVKARSISSLLGQTSSEIVAPADHHHHDDK